MKKHDYTKLEKMGIIKKAFVSDKERIDFQDLKEDELPEGVFYNYFNGSYRYWRYPDTDFTSEDIRAKIMLQNALNLRTIKICAIVFVICSSIYVLASLFFAYKTYPLSQRTANDISTIYYGAA